MTYREKIGDKDVEIKQKKFVDSFSNDHRMV